MKDSISVEFSAIPPDSVLPIWNNVAPLFEKLITRQRSSSSLVDYYKKIAINKSHLLWVTWEAGNINNILMVLLTHVNQKVLEVSSCAGKDLDKWSNGYIMTCKTLEQFGRDLGCTRSRILHGRMGWNKLLSKELNMKVTGYTYEKEL